MCTSPNGLFSIAMVTIDSDGLNVVHNFPCPSCTVHLARYDGSVFRPCFTCQAKGVDLVDTSVGFLSFIMLWWNYRRERSASNAKMRSFARGTFGH